MLSPGTLLSSRYLIQSVLGQGGMGAVYLAEVEALGGKKVAVKEMEYRGLNQSDLAQAVKQFHQEASFLANLDHPNLVPVTDFFVEGENHYLVMAYVNGETLQQRLQRQGRAFDWAQVRQWAEPLTEVLAYLHAQSPSILFRDLKPSNIMLEESGRLRLIDFGIARTQAGDRTCTFLQGTGTSGFSPIEQYGGAQSTDQRSDIYSLGATLYYLLTGKVPPDAVLRASLGQQLLPPSQLHPGLPRELDKLLERALSVKQQDRHSDINEFRVSMLALGPAVDTELVGGGFSRPPLVEEVSGSTEPYKSIVVETYPSVAALSSQKLRSATQALGIGSLLLAGFTTLLMAGKMFPTTPALPAGPTPSPSIAVKNVPIAKSTPHEIYRSRPEEEVEKRPSRAVSRAARPEVEVSQPVPTPARISKSPSPSLGGVSYPRRASSSPKAKEPSSAEPAEKPKAPPDESPKDSVSASSPPQASRPLQKGVPPGFPKPPPGAPPPVMGSDGRLYPPPRRNPSPPQREGGRLGARSSVY